jgi:hypothetical protein
MMASWLPARAAAWITPPAKVPGAAGDPAAAEVPLLGGLREGVAAVMQGEAMAEGSTTREPLHEPKASLPLPRATYSARQHALHAKQTAAHSITRIGADASFAAASLLSTTSFGEALAAALPVEEVRLALSQLAQSAATPTPEVRGEKRALWARLTADTLCKAVLALGASTLLTCLLRIQLALLGRHLFLEGNRFFLGLPESGDPTATGVSAGVGRLAAVAFRCCLPLLVPTKGRPLHSRQPSTIHPDQSGNSSRSPGTFSTRGGKCCWSGCGPWCTSRRPTFPSSCR